MMKNTFKFLIATCCAAALFSCNDELYPAIENGLYFGEAAPGNQFNQQVESFTVDQKGTIKTLTARLVKACDEDVKVTFTIDPTILEEYNKATGKNFLLLPESYRSLEGAEAVILKGSTAASVAQLQVKPFQSDNGEEYAIPVRMNYVSGPVEIKGSADKMLYLLYIPNIQKTVKMKRDCSGSASLGNVKMPQWSFEFWIRVVNVTGYDVNKGWAGNGKNDDPYRKIRAKIFADNATPFTFGGNGFFCRWWADGISGIMPTFQNEPGFGNMDSGEWWYPDTWYHLTYTYDGANLTLYKNGEVDITKGGKKDFQFKSFALGEGLPGFMEVEFAQLRLWNVCLNAAQIKDGMARQISSNTPGLYAYWKCNDGEGELLKDSCEGAHHIQLRSAPCWSEEYNFAQPNSKQ